MKKCIILTLFICILWSNAPAWCSEKGFVGIVKNVRSEAFIIRNDISENAIIGKKIEMGDVLKTGSNGSMGVIFMDDTVIAMGPKTEIFIHTFLFEPVKGNLSFIAKMVKGTVNFISGQISKLAPGSVDFQTPYFTIGDRGTHFLVKVEEE